MVLNLKLIIQIMQSSAFFKIKIKTCFAILKKIATKTKKLLKPLMPLQKKIIFFTPPSSQSNSENRIEN